VPELPRRRTEYNNAPKKCIKGDNMRSAGYSAFSGLIKNEDLGPTGDRVDLLRFLSDNKINRLIICGVATDYCVNATVMDAVNLGFNVSVIENGIMGIDPAKCEEIRTIWKSNNVEFLRL